MRINHNITALNTYNKLNSATTAQSSSMEKLSSGLRINSAADDAAGLAISEKMRGQIRGLDQASANAQDGISLIQTAEGALSETQDILQRMRELATQSANDTNTESDRGEIQKEMDQMTSEINRIGNTTEFNTKKLLNGKVNVSEASSANVKGTKLEGNSVEIVASATTGKATGSALTGNVSFHGDTAAKVTGSVAIETAGVALSGGDNNELTLTVDGTQKTIVLDQADYTTANADDLLTDINAKLDAEFTPGSARATFDDTGKLVISSGTTDENSAVKIDGGNAASSLFGANWATEGDANGIKTTARQAANDTLTISVNGVQKDVTLTAVKAGSTDGSYDATSSTDMDDLAAALQTDLETAFGTGNVTVTNNSGKLEISSTATGSVSKVSDGTGTAAAALGLTNATNVDGKDKNNEISMTVDGEVVTATLADGTYDANVLAANIQSEINADTTTDATVSFADGKFSISSGKEGTEGSVVVADNGFAKSVGLSTGSTTTAGKNAENDALKFQIGANAGQSMSVDISDMRANALEISSSTAGASKTVKDSQGNDITASYKATASVTDGTNNETVEYSLDISSADKATAAIAVLDDSITKVSAERSKLGSYQNRLDHTINNLSTSSENLTAAESRIRDVDMAKEMMNQTKNSILGQAAQAMLAQSNQLPQGVLQLLQ